MLAFTTAILMTYIWSADSEELHHWVEMVLNKLYGKYLPVSHACSMYVVVSTQMFTLGWHVKHTYHHVFSVHSRKASSSYKMHNTLHYFT